MERLEDVSKYQLLVDTCMLTIYIYITTPCLAYRLLCVSGRCSLGPAGRAVRPVSAGWPATAARGRQGEGRLSVFIEAMRAQGM